MATQETRTLDAVVASRRAMLAAGGATMAGLAFTAMTGKAYAQTAVTDTDILNFALNLEYLEAQFYTLAASGVTANSTAAGLPNPISINSGVGSVVTKNSNNYSTCKVPFTNPLVRAYALEIAFEERNHVTFLQNALSTGAIAQPALDLYNSFLGLGAKLTPAQPSFDPFANDVNFLLGAYIFEDVGVSAYHGAAKLITDKANVLAPAAKIHAVEAYHAGLIRTTLYTLDPDGSKGYLALASSISNVRASLDGSITSSTGADDVGLAAPGAKAVALESASSTYPATTQIDADQTNYIAPGRTTAQVLSIIYAGGAGKGGFFPAGLNGTIK